MGTAKKKTLCARGIGLSPLALVCGDFVDSSQIESGHDTRSGDCKEKNFMCPRNRAQSPRPRFRNVMTKELHKIHHFPFSPSTSNFPLWKTTLIPVSIFCNRAPFPLFFTLNNLQTSHCFFTIPVQPKSFPDLLTNFKHFPLLFPQFFTLHLILSTISQISKLLFPIPHPRIFRLVMQVFLQFPQIHSPYYYYYSFLISYSYSILPFLKKEKPSL